MSLRKGKKVCFLGDSITEGVGVNVEDTYWKELERNVGIVPYSYGVSGAKVCDLIGQAEMASKEVGKDADAVFIFAGTNDFFLNTPVGEWYAESEKAVTATHDADGNPVNETRRYREFVFDVGTYKGSINCLMSRIREYFPTAQIVIMTPIHRAFATFGPYNIQYSEMYSNSIGLFFDEYVSIIKEAAGIWASELIDLYSVSGFFPLNDDNAEAYFCSNETDRLHPNAEGHRRMARIIEQRLAIIPVFDK